VEHDELRVLYSYLRGELLDLPRSDQGRGFGLTDTIGDLFRDLDAYRGGKPRRLREPGIGVAAGIALVRQHDDRPRTTGELVAIAFKSCGQSSSEPFDSSARFSGRAG